jgi:uncharacterized damage-inducible protein DinB
MRKLALAVASIWRCVLDRDGDTDPMLNELLHHQLLVQHAFASVWRDEPLVLSEASAFPDLPAIARWGRDGVAELGELVQTVTEADIDRELSFPWAEEVAVTLRKPPGPVTLGESAIQVALHSSHHRGQIAARLRELGSSPPLVDWIAWLWHGRPAADWEVGVSSPQEAAEKPW